MKEFVSIGGRDVGAGRPVYVIAEIGVNFDGDLDVARRSINEAARAGADAVKFQTFAADEFVADRSLMYSYTLLNGEAITESQYGMFKRLELPDEWHGVLQNHARERGVDFLSSAADRRAADLLGELGVPAFKLASEDLINVPLLEHVAGKRRPVILSTGMADEGEIAMALKIFGGPGAADVILLHCTSSYPTPPESVNIARIPALRTRFETPVGFSDHTEGWEAAFLAVGAGACLVEKHFTIDRARRGPDHRMSADPAGFTTMVEMIRRAEIMRGAGGLTFDPIEEKGRAEFRRSIVALAAIPAGAIIREDMITYKRPGYGLKPYERDRILGRRARRAIMPDERILPEDVEGGS